VGNGRVFISHSFDDNARIYPLLAALDAWGVDYWVDLQGLSAGQRLDERIQREMTSRDIFLRVCTTALQRSFWSNLEVTAFRGLQAEDRQKRRPDQRLLINVILDPSYQREPFDRATLFIDGVNQPRAAWLADLRRALGIVGAATSGGISRRAALGYGAAALVTLSSTAAAAAFLVDYRNRTSTSTGPTHTPGKLVWQMDKLSPKKDIPPVPVVDGNTLYVATASDLTAYDLANGRKQLWRNHYTPIFGFASPLIQGGVAYFTVDGTLYALAAASGKQKWTAQVASSDRNFATSAVVGDGAAFAFSTGGGLYAFDARSGANKWRNAIGKPTSSADNVSGPAVDGSTVFIGSVDHNLYAFSTRDGSQHWKFLTRGKVMGTPAVAGGTVFFGSSDGYIYALRAADGSLKWKYLTHGAVRSSPAVADGVVFVGSDDEYLYALDAETGEPYWRAPAGDLDPSSGIITNGGPIIGYPAVTPTAVCIIDDNEKRVRCFDRDDGTQRWSYKSAGSYTNADPIAADGLILFGSGDRNLYAFGL
jgi:outer membrane protein assembly factor BamB